MAKRLPVRNRGRHEGKTGVTKFKELCMDTARSSGELGRFWASVTGCSYVEPSTPDESGDVIGRVEGEVEGMGIAICLVPEEKSAKHRVHIDVHTDSVESLLAHGARRAPEFGGDPWTVLLDPEGGELCAFVREEPPAYRTYEVVVDTADPEAQARWWAAVFGVEPLNDGQEFWFLEGVPGMPFESIVFTPVPEPKTVKNRIHWDLYGVVDDLVARGASVLAELPGSQVLADPEGNEFCVFAPPPGG